MPTRKTFIAAAAGAAATVSALGPRQALAAGPTPTPAPTHSAAPQPAKPSQLANGLARSLQHDLPNARLSDSTTAKIAADIQDNFAIGNAFRGRKNEDLPPPDFIFVAADVDRP